MGDFFENDNGCVKQSTRCLFWYGGKLCSITVCNGESFESVISKMDKKLKSLDELFSLDGINFMDILAEKQCPPKSIKDLLNLILESISSSTTLNPESTFTLPKITVAGCFEEDFVSTNGVTDLDTYVEYLGSQVCVLKQENSNLKESLKQLQQDYQNLSNQFSTFIGE